MTDFESDDGDVFDLDDDDRWLADTDDPYHWGPSPSPGRLPVIRLAPDVVPIPRRAPMTAEVSWNDGWLVHLAFEEQDTLEPTVLLEIEGTVTALVARVTGCDDPGYPDEPWFLELEVDGRVLLADLSRERRARALDVGGPGDP